MGALVGAGLMLIVVTALSMIGGLFGFLPGLDATGFVPLLPIRGAFQVSCLATGAAAGGLTGCVVGLSRSAALGVIVSTIVFAALRAWSLMRMWSRARV